MTNLKMCDKYYMTMRRPLQPITNALKEAIRASKMTWLELEKATKVKRASLMRFMAGTQTLRLDMADRLAVYLGIKCQCVRTKQNKTQDQKER